MVTRSSPNRLPWWGYVVLNLAAGGFLMGVYAFSWTTIGQRVIPPYFTVPVLAFVWVCFVVASVCDAVLDRREGEPK